MLYDSCTGIYKFGNNTYPQRIRCRSNLGHIFWEKKCVLWAGEYGMSFRMRIVFRSKQTIKPDFFCMRKTGRRKGKAKIQQ
jgi:hypothetical protein